MTKDPFTVLGISSSASEDEIKSAYRKLAKKYHPDLNPGDKAAEEKMKEVNEAYAEAMRIRKGGGQSSYSGQWSNGGQYGEYNRSGSTNGNSNGYGGYGYDRGPFGQSGWGQGGPFGGFDPFGDFFRGSGAGQGFRTRNYGSPDLKTAENYILSRQYHEALTVLNRVPTHNADWHALYARADLGMGNRISALEHARKASQMAPNDPDYQQLLRQVESGRQEYRQTQQNGYDFRSVVCGNPFLTCCTINILLNCCLGGRFCCC